MQNLKRKCKKKLNVLFQNRGKQIEREQTLLGG